MLVGKDARAVNALVGVILLASVCLIFCSCENVPIGSASDGGAVSAVADEPAVAGKNAKNFTFTVKGDWQNPTFTRAAGYLSADGYDMTDLWVFDYMDGSLVQAVHQTPESAGDDWGKPKMPLKYGEHHVYFVCSRGEGASVDGDVVTWTNVKDTFWKDYAVTVGSTSNGNRAVTLDRVATRLRVSPTDAIPEACAALKIAPAKWYYGLNYRTGEATNLQSLEKTINVPDSYRGTTGQLTVSVYGISGGDEWTTDIMLKAVDADGSTLGSVNMVAVPFLRNRSTEMSGGLFALSTTSDVSLSSEWSAAYVGGW